MGGFFAGFAIRDYRRGKIIIRDYKKGRRAVDGSLNFRFIYKDKSPIEFRCITFGRLLASSLFGVTPLLLEILKILKHR